MRISLVGVAVLVLAGAPCASDRSASAGGRPKSAPTDAGSTLAACARDADCALTDMPEVGCCENACETRAVTVAEARSLEARRAQCGKACPIRDCMPPRGIPSPACEAGHCVVRRVSNE